MCTDLGNDAAPAGSAVATLTCKAFKTWMNNCGYDDIDEGNTGQIVVKLHKEADVIVNNITFTPNWHITAMTDKMKSKCLVFHFKIEATKACAHYWHYVLHYHSTNATWHWVGAPNDKGVKGRNDAGGGAAGDAKKLDANRSLVNTAAATNGLADKVTKATQAAMVAKLKELTDSKWIKLKNSVWDT